jgi:hypothetical protein
MMNIAADLRTQLSQELRRLELDQRFELKQRVDALIQTDKPDRVELGTPGSIDTLQAMLLEKLEAPSDLREDKIAQARERIAQGFYQEEAVVEKMAERVLNQSAIVDSKNSLENTQTEAAYRQTLVKDVQTKIDSGFYSDNEVMGFVAERLLQIHDVPE